MSPIRIPLLRSLAYTIVFLCAVNQLTAQLNTVSLGRSSSLYPFLNGIPNRVATIPDLDVIGYVHPQDVTIWGGSPYNDGFLRYSYSLDRGFTFSNEAGPLQMNSTGRALWPNLAFYSPPGTTNPFDSDLVYTSTMVDSNGLGLGALHGNTELGPQIPFNIKEHDLLDQDAGQPICMTERIPGEFWTVEQLTMGGLLSDTIRLQKGVWNINTDSVEWSLAADIAPNWNTSFDGTVKASGPVIAFSPNGQQGWIGLLGDITGGRDLVMSPIFIHSSDGGNTWGSPVEMDMNTILGLSDSLQSWGTDAFGLPLSTGIATCGPDLDLVVDQHGYPHLLAAVGSAATQTNPVLGYAFQHGLPAYLIDFYQLPTPGQFMGHLVTSLRNTEFTIGGMNPVAMSNYPQISRSIDGTKVYYTWVDEDTTTGLPGEPDLAYAGWRMSDGYRVCPQWVTAQDLVWSGRAICPQMAPVVMEDQGIDYLPVVMMEMVTNDPAGPCGAYYFGNALTVDNLDFLPPSFIGGLCFPFCGYYQGGDFEGLAGTVTGTVWDDLNANGVQDGSESGRPNIILALNNNQGFTATDGNGDYSFQLLADSTFEIRVQSGQNLNQTHPAPTPYHTVTVPAAGIVAGKDFGLQDIQNLKDVQVVAITTQQRPGFSHYQTLVVSNPGNMPVSGTLFYRYDAPLNFLNASPVAATSNGTDSITWNFSLQPLQTAYFQAEFNLPASTPLGLVTQAYAYVENQGNELTLTNNYDTLETVVVGSFDPNDKHVSPTDIVEPDTWLTYTIRFQNTGTASAVNVKVLDFLDVNLDHSTFEMIAASHPYRLEVNSSLDLAWYFDGINLPDSTNDEHNSHGFIQFKVKTKSVFSALPVSISNRAGIYFDFNAPIVTNTTWTWVDIMEGGRNGAIGWELKVYPHPVEDVVSIEVGEGTARSYQLRLFDIQGKELKRIDFWRGDRLQFQRGDLPNGIYLFQLSNDQGKMLHGKLLFR